MTTNPRPAADRTMASLQKEVGSWSAHNFGSNISVVTCQTLDEIPSVLGIAEEVGEFVTAFMTVITGPRCPETRDAIGDVAIFLCDFAARVRMELQDPRPRRRADSTPFRMNRIAMQICAHAGRISHIVLKRHQGIRGFGEDQIYRDGIQAAAQGLLASLDEYSVAAWNDRIMTVAWEIWDAIVKKRNWNRERSLP